MQPNEKETFDVHELNVSAIFMYLPLAFAAEYVNVILSLVFHFGVQLCDPLCSSAASVTK